MTIPLGPGTGMSSNPATNIAQLSQTLASQIPQLMAMGPFTFLQGADPQNLPGESAYFIVMICGKWQATSLAYG